MRRPYFLRVKGHRGFNVHRSRDCHRLSFQVRSIGFRWDW